MTEADKTLQLLIDSSGDDNGLNLSVLSSAVENAVVTPKFRNSKEAVAEVDKAVRDIMEGSSNISMEQIIWNRVNRDPAVTIRDAQKAAYDIIRSLGEFTESMNTDSGVTLVDARGCSLNQVLYFIGQGYPVLAYVENGSYVLLNGFDQYNVSIFDPSTGQSVKMGLNDGGQYFANLKNDFICAVTTGDLQKP